MVIKSRNFLEVKDGEGVYPLPITALVLFDADLDEAITSDILPKSCAFPPDAMVVNCITS